MSEFYDPFWRDASRYVKACASRIAYFAIVPAIIFYAFNPLVMSRDLLDVVRRPGRGILSCYPECLSFGIEVFLQLESTIHCVP